MEAKGFRQHCRSLGEGGGVPVGYVMRLYPLGEFIAGHCHTSAQRRDAALPRDRRLVGIVDGEDRQRRRGLLLLRLRAVASQRHQRRDARLCDRHQSRAAVVDENGRQAGLRRRLDEGRHRAPHHLRLLRPLALFGHVGSPRRAACPATLLPIFRPPLLGWGAFVGGGLNLGKLPGERRNLLPERGLLNLLLERGLLRPLRVSREVEQQHRGVV
mmetsp:Transcript_33264/g.101605  ORF Transcript_33264/g.101605 Transcript_33264/m.101605 type:complete len:214 (+) Transcript_33264:63-704(+)